MRSNGTKQRMAQGLPALGVSLTIPDSFVAEMVGAAAFDFVLIDTEHAPIGVGDLQNMLIALRGSASTSFVRPVANDAALIKQILDLGAEGVIVPEVRSAADCAAAVAATRYPPAGVRGFGPRRAARLDGGRPAYLSRADDEIAAFVMIEHPDAVDDIDAILATPGLDGIMVGPADLGASMGHLTDPGHADVQAAIDRVLAACQRRSFPFGIFAAAESAAKSWIGRGALFATIGSDVQFLDQGLTRARALAGELGATEPVRAGS
jgi:2-keto-3-deoxy-L-rhamnonate aldolase RhmA